jgi:hypothetical protein
MNVSSFIQDFVQYLTEGFARIFSPNNDEYPNVGIQPYEGDPYQASSEADW